jgi:hypothetical protein
MSIGYKNFSLKTNDMKKRVKLPAINFAITVDGAPVNVVAVPYIAADEKKRFRVSYNGSPIHIFALNENARKMEVLDSASETIPMNMERAIGDTLLHKIAA